MSDLKTSPGIPDSQDSHPEIDFRIIFSGIPCAYIALWPDMTIIEGTCAFAKAMHIQPNHFRGQFLWDALPYGEKEEALSTIKALKNSLGLTLKNKIPHSIYLQRIDIKNAEGIFKEKYWNLTNTPVLDKENRVIYIMHKVEDVTDFVTLQKQQKIKNGMDIPGLMDMEMEIMKRSIEVQQRNEDLAKRLDEGAEQLDIMNKNILDYKYALEVSSIISITGRDGKIQYVNDHFCEVSGYTVEELLYQDHRIVNSGYHSKEFFRKLWATIINGKVWKGEIKNIAKDGSFYWLDTTIVPFLDAKGVPQKYLSIHNDVTKRKQAFEKIKTSEANYKALFENSAVSIFISDLSGEHPLAVNTVGAQIFGYKTKAEFLTSYNADRHYVAHEEVRKNIELLKETGELTNEIQQLKRLDGTKFWVNANVKLHPEKNRMYTFLIDITKEIQLKSEVEQKVKELETKNKDLEVFNYISTHDLQEPLRKIQNLISVLLTEEKANLSKQGREYLKTGYETSQRMRNLLNDLLMYARVKNAAFGYEKKELGIVLKEVLKDFKHIIKQTHAKVELVDGCEINIIPFQFQQVIHNLIGNALKFTQPGVAPHVIVTCEVVKGKKLKMPKLDSDLNYTHISITDNGIGFDPQYKERIFEVFQRLYTNEFYEGTGIGLAICKRIVENHHGVITATGDVNKGARFDIYLPLD